MKGEKIRKEVYEDLKIWDKKREQKLKKHLEIVEEILENLENKIEDSHLYMASIEELFKNRLKQLVLFPSCRKPMLPNHSRTQNLCYPKIIFPPTRHTTICSKHLLWMNLFKSKTSTKKLINLESSINS